MTTEQPPVEQFQIGEVAERTGLSIRTIRHYEEVGLVVPSSRSTGRFRLYSPQDVARLRTLRHMKPLGFPLEEMRTLMEAMDTIAAGRASTSAGEDAHEVVRRFHGVMTERVRQAREHLTRAEEFAVELEDRLRG
jgi:MerR family transcriptional regulator, copper efflux regulator